MSEPRTVAAEITDIEMLRAFRAGAESRGYLSCTVWDAAVALDGHLDVLRAYADEIKRGDYRKDAPAAADFWRTYEAGTRDTVIRKKARRLYRRGLITGCICGCRGDFELTAKGNALLDGVS